MRPNMCRAVKRTMKSTVKRTVKTQHETGNLRRFAEKNWTLNYFKRRSQQKGFFDRRANSFKPGHRRPEQETSKWKFVRPSKMRWKRQSKHFQETCTRIPPARIL